MKSVILLLVFIIAVSCIVAQDLELRFGNSYDVLGKHNAEYTYQDMSSTIKGDVRTGISPYVEFLRNGKRYSAGLGLSYQLPRTMKNEFGSSEFSFIPVYFVASYKISPDADISPEIVGHAGYNFFSAKGFYPDKYKVEGGIYYGIGLGLRKDMFFIQAMYRMNHYSMRFELEGDDPQYEYDRRYWAISNSLVNLTVGISLF